MCSPLIITNEHSAGSKVAQLSLSRYLAVGRYHRGFYQLEPGCYSLCPTL